MAETPTEAPGAVDALSGLDIEGLVPQLVQKLEQGEANERHLAELKFRQKEENQKIRRMLQILDADHFAVTKPQPAPTKKRNNGGRPRVGVTTGGGTATGFGITVETASNAAQVLMKMVADGEELSQSRAQRVLGWDQGKVSALFRYLRSIEFLGRAGKSADKRRNLWRIIDDEAIERAMNQRVPYDEAVSR